MGTELTTGFDCGVCGQHHDVLPLSYSTKAPMALAQVPPNEWDTRVAINRDQCVVDGREFYLRGRILIPVEELEEPFVWGVWAEISPKNFIRVNEMWNHPQREKEPPFVGWLNTELPLYGPTWNLEVSIQTREVGWRPYFTVVDGNHPLAIEQREGMDLERVQEVAEMLLHPEGNSSIPDTV